MVVGWSMTETMENWAVRKGWMTAHTFDDLPRADAKSYPRRKRRSLTEDELGRLLTTAADRPLADARTVRRGKNKGLAVANLTPGAGARLRHVGREQALIYKATVLTGLRCGELRTLEVAQLDLTPGGRLPRTGRGRREESRR